jgi:general transcription factor 3C polypeptide 3 (transcription factor C subunit 4)
LHPEDDAEGSTLFNYPDLFRETADALQQTGLHNEALTFYEPLQQVDAYSDLKLYTRMASSYRAVGLFDRAEQCYRFVMENDKDNIDVRAELARMFEGLGRSDDAFAYATEVLELARLGRQRRGLEKPVDTEHTDAFLLRDRQKEAGGALAKYAPVTLTPEQQRVQEEAATQAAQEQYLRLQVIAELMRAGEPTALREWMDTAEDLIGQFRRKRVFYPWLKYYQFTGYSLEARRRINRPTRKKPEGAAADMEDMANRLELQAFGTQILICTHCLQAQRLTIHRSASRRHGHRQRRGLSDDSRRLSRHQFPRVAGHLLRVCL